MLQDLENIVLKFEKHMTAAGLHYCDDDFNYKCKTCGTVVYIIGEDLTGEYRAPAEKDLCRTCYHIQQKV